MGRDTVSPNCQDAARLKASGARCYTARRGSVLGSGPGYVGCGCRGLVDTGLRPEECFRLRWETITWTNGRFGTLIVTHGKTASARRVLPMTPRVRKILE